MNATSRRPFTYLRQAQHKPTTGISVKFEISAAQIYIHLVVNPPVRRGYMTRRQAIQLLADKSELLLVMQQLTGRHPAPQPLIYPRVIRNKYSPSLVIVSPLVIRVDDMKGQA